MSKQDEARGSTFFAHTDIELQIGGRYGAALPTTHVVGSTAVPNYPAASAPFQRDPVGLEPPLSYRVDELPEPEPASPSSVAAQATDGLPAPSTPASMSEAGGPSFSLGDPTSEDFPASGQRGQRVGSLPFRRRRL
jgi:hypothetical protein